jgi:hypothetical protein
MYFCSSNQIQRRDSFTLIWSAHRVAPVGSRAVSLAVQRPSVPRGTNHSLIPDSWEKLK